MKKFFLSRFLGLALTAVSASWSFAGGTPVGAIAIDGYDFYVILINFSSDYTDAQIGFVTMILWEFASELATSYAQVFSRTELASLGLGDADALHAALLPSVEDYTAYFYITATKVGNVTSGRNLRFDLTVYGPGLEPGLYTGALELSEPLFNMFID